MLIGVDLNEVKKVDIQGTIFSIGVIKNSNKFDLTKGIDFTNMENVNFNTDKILTVLKLGLRKIENIQIAGKPVTIDKIDDSILDILPLSIIPEIVEKIFTFNFPTEEQKKN